VSVVPVCGTAGCVRAQTSNKEVQQTQTHIDNIQPHTGQTIGRSKQAEIQ
jgi:hypothetical protein